MSEPIKVYLAGKIRKNDWRHTIFRDLGSDGFTRDGMPILRRDNERDGFLCCGPFFIDCDHGCFHGPGEHGIGIESGGCGSGSNELVLTRQRAIKLCRGWIDECDVVFCYLDGSNAFGTIFELGYAGAKEKPIFLAFEAVDDAHNNEFDPFDWVEVWRHSWFVRYSAQRVVGAPDALAAWGAFVEWYRRENHIGAEATALGMKSGNGRC
jgi:hypothetical protein